MGNTPGKEVRPRSSSYGSYQSGHPSSGASNFDYSPSNPFSQYEARSRRNTTSSVFSHIGAPRKSKKQEEKDRQREEHYLQLIVKHDESIDGGYLAPYGTYKSNLDFNIQIVRELIISRKIAPFYTPLQDFDESWSDEELLTIVKQLTLHLIEGAYSGEEEEDDVDDHKIHKLANFYKRQDQKLKFKILIENVKELQKQEEERFVETKLRDPKNPNLASDDLLLRLYRNPVECPICFVYYPDNLNVSRCCLQPICTECFVQIKRLDPHPPHDDPLHAPGEELPHTLILEPANCPYCAVADFGVIFDKSLEFSTGINGISPQQYKNQSKNQDSDSNENAIKSEDDASLGEADTVEPPASESNARRRRASEPASSPMVITTDQIRPDWEAKLISARSKLARKAAAASAIHASNLIINPNTDMPEYDPRRRRSTTSSLNAGSSRYHHLQTVEDRMIEEALRLSILDEEERKIKEREKKNKGGSS